MSKNVIINGTTYSGISEVSLPISGGTAKFKDEDEIIEPAGTIEISTNGTHNVKTYENAIVNVPTNSSPSGTIEITSNGTHDVTNYASAEVNVPVGITPSGTLDISSNGTHDVTNYASVNVNVESGGSFSATELPVTYYDAGSISSITVTNTDGTTTESTTSNSAAARFVQYGGILVPTPSLDWTGTIFIRYTGAATMSFISTYVVNAFNATVNNGASERFLCGSGRSMGSSVWNANCKILHASSVTIDGTTYTNNGNGYIVFNAYSTSNKYSADFKATYIAESYF